jgi:hypothetical protein
VKELWDYLEETVDAVASQLHEDDKRWGKTWRKRLRAGQEERIEEHIQSYFDQFRNAGVPVPWLKIIGLAHIALVRENHPEELEKE